MKQCEQQFNLRSVAYKCHGPWASAWPLSHLLVAPSMVEVEKKSGWFLDETKSSPDEASSSCP